MFKIVFASSDNNKSSGAFLSMVRLCLLLRSKFQCKVYIILPRHGDGQVLLDEHNIQYKYIRSFNWTISISKKNKFTQILCFAKQIYNCIAIYRIQHFITKYDIDIVHVNTSWTYAAAVAALHVRRPLVWHLREFLEEDQGVMIWNRVNAYNLLSKADRIVAISSSIKNKYSSLLHNSHIVTILNGIDESPYLNINHSIFSSHCINLLMVGTISSSKGQYQLIKACKKLVENGINNFYLNIVGRGEDTYIEKLCKYVNKQDLHQYIHFAGYHKNVEYFYRNADITFICSKQEAFGRVTVEAMMAGSLVIGADTGATTELISDHITGLTYKFGDIDDLVQQIRWAIENPHESQIIANNGRKYMINNMTASKNAEKIFEIYREIAS